MLFNSFIFFIFLAVVLRGLERLSAALRAAVERTTAVESGLRALGEAFFDFALAQPEYLDLMMVYEARNFIYYEPVSPNTEESYRCACQSVSDGIAQLVLDTIARAIENQTIRTHLTPRQLMLILWGQIFGVMQILRIRARHFDETFGISRKQLFEHFIEMTHQALTG